MSSNDDVRLAALSPGMRRYVHETEAFEARTPPAATPTEGRARYAARCALFPIERPTGISVMNATIAGVPTRVYRPHDARGTIVFFHGGGWVVGDLDTHDGVAAQLAARAGAEVVAVDYRLAPEHRYPAAFEDARRVTEAVLDRGVVVSGDSAGGNLAAAVALALRDRGALRGQVLFYPCLDSTLSLPGCLRQAHAPLLSREAMQGYWRAYLGARTSEDAFASPLAAPAVAGVAPAHVATAAIDPLVDDGRMWAERLRREGVTVTHREAPRLLHGYLRAIALCDEASAELDAAAAAARTMLG